MCAFFFASAISLYGQGSLSPPAGPPAPTMKRLSYIDPGESFESGQLGATQIQIDQSGYYYLTGNVTTVLATEAAIVVNASFVTIDLRGFSIVHNRHRQRLLRLRDPRQRCGRKRCNGAQRSDPRRLVGWISCAGDQLRGRSSACDRDGELRHIAASMSKRGSLIVWWTG